MTVEIKKIGKDDLPLYAEISIAFEVKSVLQLRLIRGGLGGIRLDEQKIEPTYIKDYDAYEDQGPQRWPTRFDTDRWGIFLATQGARPAAGATVAFDTPGVTMLEGRSDLAVLWDIRVHPELRGRGIATRLFAHAVDWSRRQGCRQLKIETQDVNVPACRFYRKAGCRLGVINRHAYQDCAAVANEVMLIWYLDL